MFPILIYFLLANGNLDYQTYNHCDNLYCVDYMIRTAFKDPNIIEIKVYDKDIKFGNYLITPLTGPIIDYVIS